MGNHWKENNLNYLGKKIGIIACLLLVVGSVNLQACNACDKFLDLTANQWSCLNNKLPGLLKKNLSLVLFQLPEECVQAKSLASHKSADPTMPIRVNSKNATQTYIITESQLNCVEREIKEILKMDDTHMFIFKENCGKSEIE